ncbi:MAG TPA: hypothetical protein VGN93_30865 [Shinella sp.]|jgi:hypothetical protein|uniref:hypothetical protein n=1 Tax=Shinella sp. TaxID=1870904 RepID=UPI002E112AC2|nr:hypothetical protein [Shinella sp.]
MTAVATRNLFDRPLTFGQRAFLRSMRRAGGSVRIVGVAEMDLARSCLDAGYATISQKRDRAFISELGCAYLDRIARVE